MFQALDTGKTLFNVLDKKELPIPPQFFMRLGRLSLKNEDFTLALDYFYRAKIREGYNELGKLRSKSVTIVETYIKRSQKQEGFEFVTELKRIFPRLLYENEELSLFLAQNYNMPELAKPRRSKIIEQAVQGNQAKGILPTLSPAKSKKSKIGRLYVETSPKGAQVKFFQSKYKYKYGIPLQSGNYIIEVSNMGYETKVIEIDIVSGKDTNLAISLIAIKGKYKLARINKNNSKGILKGISISRLFQKLNSCENDKRCLIILALIAGLLPISVIWLVSRIVLGVKRQNDK